MNSQAWSKDNIGQRQNTPVQNATQNITTIVLKNYIGIKNGYFNNNNVIKSELLGATALSVAKTLGVANTTYTQIRAFFHAAKAIQRVYSSRGKFEQIVPNLERLIFLAAYYMGKGKDDWERKKRENLKDFIDSNIFFAKENPHNFKDGFIPHFEAVMGYFKWLYPKE